MAKENKNDASKTVKRIRVPEDMEIETGIGANGEGIMAPFTFFRHFLVRSILSDRQTFGASHETVYTAAAIKGAFEGKNAGVVVSLPIDHYEKLKAVVMKPSEGYTPFIMMQVTPYIDAILNPVNEP